MINNQICQSIPSSLARSTPDLHHVPSHQIDNHQLIIHYLIDHLIQNVHLLPPLIFRCTGNIQRQRNLCESLEKCESVTSVKLTGVSLLDIGNLLKHYLSKYSLLSVKFEEIFHCIYKMTENMESVNDVGMKRLRQAKQLRCYRIAFLLLAREDRCLFLKLLSLLHEIGVRSELQMSYESLSICFVPHIFPHSTSSPHDNAQEGKTKLSGKFIFFKKSGTKCKKNLSSVKLSLFSGRGKYKTNPSHLLLDTQEHLIDFQHLMMQLLSMDCNSLADVPLCLYEHVIKTMRVS
jgi:hypothetical protein